MVVTIAKIVAAVFLAMFFISFLFWGMIGVVNFIASFLSFSLVAAATFFGYKKLVLSPTINFADKSISQDGEDEDGRREATKISILAKTYKGWLSPLRLLAYGLFVLIFLYFANNNILHIFAFLTGIAVLPISTLIFTLFFRREF